MGGEYEQQMFEQLIKKLQESKTAALKDKMKALGILAEFEELEAAERELRVKPRFNKFMVVNYDKIGELYYYDNGTVNGLFIVGFTLPKNELPDLNPAANFQPKVTLSCRMIEVEPEAVKLKDWDNEQVLRASEKN